MALLVDSFSTHRHNSVRAYQRLGRHKTVLGFLALYGLTTLVALRLIFVTPSPTIFVWFIYFAGLVTCVVQPRYGLYLIIAFSLIGDWMMWPEYPFLKNFSSEESWFFLHNRLIFNPLETYLVAILVSWLAQDLARRRFAFRGGPLFGPLMVFIACVTVMLGYGLLRSGNANVALWEVRPIYHLALVFVLAANLIRTRRHVNVLLWTLLISIAVRGLIGVIYVYTVLGGSLADQERIGSHAMSIFFDSVFVMTIGAFLFREHLQKRLWLVLLLPPIVFSFFANQRRAGFIALGIALVMLGIVLFYTRRRLFWRVVPVALMLGLLYMGVFWNSSNPIGFGAKALRSVIGLADARDAQSNAYRDIENANIIYTIRSAPQGLGFGQKFYIIFPMADISFFEWWEYITHNAVLWIWMKAGVWGFVSMLTLIGTTLIVGAQSIRKMPDGVLRNTAVTFTLYLMMHFVYTYVDMAWETQSMVYVGTAMGVLSVLALIAAAPEPVRSPRWPWSPATGRV